MTIITKQKFEVLATFTTSVTKSTAPQFKHPNIGDVMGIGNEVITVTAENQKEFIAPYTLEGEDISLLTCGFEDKITLSNSNEIEGAWLFEVVGALLTSNKLTLTITMSIDVDNVDQAIEIFKNELKGYELHCLEFRDNNTNQIYYIEVDSIHNEEWEFDVID